MVGHDAQFTLGRRRFVGGLATAAAGALVLGGPGRPLLNGLPWFAPARPFTRTEVAARIGETFRITTGVHEGIRLTLAGIAELPSTRIVVPDDQFAARFVAPAGADLFPDTYEFATDAFGDLPLYVSPLVDVDGVVTGYEALVNRYVPPGVEVPPIASGEVRP